MVHKTAQLWFLVISLHAFPTHSSPRNVTIDDYYGDLITGEEFNYVGAWSVGQGRSTSFANLDLSQLYEGTWHVSSTVEGTSATYTTVNFPGNALWVYGVLMHSAMEWKTGTNLTFFVDGQATGSFLKIPVDSEASDATYDYNVLLFHRGSLVNEMHNFTLVNEMNSSIILDRMVYTTFNETPTNATSGLAEFSDSSVANSHGFSDRAIAVIAVLASVGSILVFILILTLCHLRTRRWRRDVIKTFVSNSSVNSLTDVETTFASVVAPPTYEEVMSSRSSSESLTTTRSEKVFSVRSATLRPEHSSAVLHSLSEMAESPRASSGGEILLRPVLSVSDSTIRPSASCPGIHPQHRVNRETLTQSDTFDEDTARHEGVKLGYDDAPIKDSPITSIPMVAAALPMRDNDSLEPPSLARPSIEEDQPLLASWLEALGLQS